MKNAIDLRGLRKEYKGFTLDNISLSLPMGCIMGFIGENGAGKSTTIKAMLGPVSYTHLDVYKRQGTNRAPHKRAGSVRRSFFRKQTSNTTVESIST